MNKVFTAKYLQHLNQKKRNKEEGFTLIELLVVVIIIGVLAAVALPNLLGQVGKARETEGKNAMGTINRAQQSYHFEKQTFAPTLSDTALAANNVLGVVVKSTYYSFTTTGGNGTTVAAVADARNASKDGIRPYSSAIGFDTSAGQYATVVCQTDQIQDAAIDADNTTTPALPQCPPNTTPLR
jgi:prepilin-type N-terminal cleavage/methylation domain-containing protein